MVLAALLSNTQNLLTLTVNTEKQQNGTVIMIVDSCDNSSGSGIEQQDCSSLAGCSMQELFPNDAHSLGEWIDFYARVQYGMPGLDQYLDADGAYCKKIHQYFHTVSNWITSTITCKQGERLFTVQLAPGTGSDALQSPHVRQLMELKQMLCVGRVLTDTLQWELDWKTRSVFLSQKIAALLGFDNYPQLITLEQFFDCVHPDDHHIVQQALQDAGSIYDSVFSRAVRPDGTILHLCSFAIPQFDCDGNVARVVGLTQDVTSYVHATEHSTMSEKLLSSVMEHSKNATFIINDKGVYSYASPNVKELYGLDPNKMVGSSFGDYLPTKSDSDRVLEEFQQIMLSRSPGHIEFEYYNPQSNLINCVRMNVSPLINSHGSLHEALITAHNITEEHNHEDRLRYLQTHDILTDTFNRFYFEQEIMRIQRGEVAPVSLIIADLNGLKVVNDAFSHEMGDQLLVETAKILKAVCASTCTISRIGGDEFAILLYDTSLAEAEAISEAIVDACRAMPSHLLPISLSCGVACRDSTTLHTTSLYSIAESRLINSKLLETQSKHSHVIASLKEAIGVRNVETFDHMRRMESMVSALGKRLKLTTSEFGRLLLLASLHDIGKVAIPDHIINKPSQLSPDEWVVMKSHSDVGYRIAMASSELSGIAEEIRSHHERWDGTGYPAGKKGEQIPLLSRIISVVDSYDVMTSKRVYKKPISHFDALAELQRCSGTQFDPTIVSLFMEIFGSFSQDDMDHFNSCCQAGRANAALPPNILQ